MNIMVYNYQVKNIDIKVARGAAIHLQVKSIQHKTVTLLKDKLD